jgi:hypothetical protein
MIDMNMDLGRMLLTIGIVLAIAGGLFMLLGKTGLPKLPGDILIKKDNFTFYFPWVTSIVVSIVLSLIFYLFFRK